MDDLTPPAHCFCCGHLTDAQPPDDISAELTGLPQWRCYSCFTVIAGWRLHCHSCGDSRGNPQASRYRDLYLSADLACACQVITPPGSGDRRNVSYLVVAFILLLVCIVTGDLMLSEEHAARDDMIGSGIMYLVILGYVAANWNLITSLFRFTRQALPMMLVAVLAAPLTVGLAFLQPVVFPALQDYWTTYSGSYLDEGYGWGTIVLSIAVGPAIFEELFFRGVMLHRLTKMMAPWEAIIVTAMAFAILHMSSIGFVFYLVPMAVIAGWMTLRSGSLWPAIFYHFLHNGTVVYLEYMGVS